MIYLYTAFIILLSSFLWRVRGGLRFNNKKLPTNKIWYAVFFALCGYFHFGNSQAAIIGFICCYASYQLYGWGLYVGRLLNGGELNPNLVQYRECELIDDLLYPMHITLKGQKYYLYQHPRLFGFCGTTLTGLIITFLWGLYLGNLVIMVSGLGMGAVYWIGGQIEKIYPLGKSGWNWGEWIFGAYLGGWLVWVML